MKTRDISFLAILILPGLLVSCKSGSVKSSHQNIDEDSISRMAYPRQEIKINPDEAIVVVFVNNITKLEKGQKISCKLLKIEKQGFGFSSNLIEGDILIIHNITANQLDEINKQVRCVINGTELMGQEEKTFTLVKILDP